MRFISEYGYLFVFLIVALENGAFVGLFVPGETILLTASFVASMGILNIYILIPVVISAAFLGDNLAYFLGKRGGRPLLVKYGPKFRISEKRLKKAEDFYERHGAKTVLIGRWTAFLRTFTAFLAGVNKMKYPKFFLFNAIGAITWGLGNCLFGYFFGKNIDLILSIIHKIGWTTVGVVIVIILIWYVWRRWLRNYLFRNM
jgi:membrane protein DedA with SNARE-associated domain